MRFHRCNLCYKDKVKLFKVYDPFTNQWTLMCSNCIGEMPLGMDNQ